MFARLWKRSPVAETTDQCQFTIERHSGHPIRFNGVLQVESIGQSQVGYRQGDPWHWLKVYQVDSGSYAIVIEFHISATVVTTDAGIVGSLSDVDDFFCMHGGEHFHQMILDSEAGSAVQCDKQLEQRVLKNYDRQILEVLNQLSHVPGKSENEA